MAIEDTQQAAKYGALAAMAAGQPTGPDPMQEADQTAMAAAARNATGVPADYQSQLASQVAAPKDVADRLIANNDAASQGVIAAEQALGQTGGATTLPSSSTTGASQAADNAILTKILSRYNTNLDPGGTPQYGGYHTAAEADNAITGRALQLAAQQEGADANAHQQANVWTAGATPLVQGYNAAQARLGAGQAAAGDPWTQGFLQLGANTVAAANNTTAPTVHTLAPAPQTQGATGTGGDTLARLVASGATGQPPAPIQTGVGQLPTADALTQAVAAAYERPFNPQSDTVGFTIDPVTGQVSGNPAHISLFQQGAGRELGIDPYILAGQYTPQSGLSYATNMLQGGNAYDAASIEAQQRAANAANPNVGQPLTNSEVNGQVTDSLRASPAYQSGADLADSLLKKWTQDPNTPVTVDDFKLELASKGITSPLLVKQLVNDFGPRFAGSSYIPSPDVSGNAGGNPTGP